MIHHGQAVMSGILNSTAHHSVVLDATAVIGQRHHPGGRQGADRSHLLSGKPLGDSSRAEDIHAGRGSSALLDPGNRCRTVCDRRGVRHADHRGKSAGCSAPSSGCNRLFVRLSRLTEMDMDVDKSRRDHLAGGIDDLGTSFTLFSLGKRIDDDSIPDEEISDSVDSVCRIDDAASLDVQ